MIAVVLAEANEHVSQLTQHLSSVCLGLKWGKTLYITFKLFLFYVFQYIIN